MPNSDFNTGAAAVQNGADSPTVNLPEPEYRTVFVESPNVFASLLRQIRERLREPRITVPPEYYRGEARLPLSEMRPWFRDLPSTLKELPELSHYGLLRLGRRLHLLPKSMEVPDIWQDFKQEPGSWLNSLLVHVVALTALLLPYYIIRWLHPAKPADNTVAIDISPYLPQLPPSTHKAGGGGGGGDRSPTPASKGAIPKFAKEQFTPPVAKILNPMPKLPMTPTLVGPPELKLPQMQLAQMGDPMGVNGPASNGPGAYGGIGSGSGGGIGSGNGRGLGPGEGGGTGGGVYDVGGNVTAPVPIYEPDPPYSEEARKAKYSGTVVVVIIVDASGNVVDAQVLRPAGLGLDQKAVDTVRTWKFKPATKNGVPVKVRVSVEVTFRLF